MNKPLIICVIGESGAGKTTLAEQLKERYGIDLIQSYTDRPQRYEGENGHTFLTTEQFDAIYQENIIAYTKFGNYRYCCVHSGVKDLNTYVLDEIGFDYLKANFSDLYNIKSIRIVCSEAERIRRVGLDRVGRDKGMFSDDYGKFDLIYNSELHDSILNVPVQRYWLESQINQQFGYDVDYDNLIFMQ